MLIKNGVVLVKPVNGQIKQISRNGQMSVAKQHTNKVSIKFVFIINFIYFKCKWYFIPFLPLYKNGKAGLLEIYTLNRKYCCRIFYKDYKQLKQYLVILEK